MTMSEPRTSRPAPRGPPDPGKDKATIPRRSPEPDTLEGPGGRDEAKGEADARNKATRRGER